jgi:hypothetical protein
MQFVWGGLFAPASVVRFTCVAGLNFLQHIRTNPEGFAHFTLSGDYYNRALSGQYKLYIIV